MRFLTPSPIRLMIPVEAAPRSTVTAPAMMAAVISRFLELSFSMGSSDTVSGTISTTGLVAAIRFLSSDTVWGSIIGHVYLARSVQEVLRPKLAERFFLLKLDRHSIIR